MLLADQYFSPIPFAGHRLSCSFKSFAWNSSLNTLQGDAVLDTDDIDYETEHDSRKRHVAMQDPVHTVVLKDYVQNQVRKNFSLIKLFLVASLA